MKTIILFPFFFLFFSCYKDQVIDIPKVEIVSPKQDQKFIKGDTIPVEFHITSEIGISAIKIVHDLELIGGNQFYHPIVLDQFDSNKSIHYSGSFLTNGSTPSGYYTLWITIFDKHNGGMIISRDYYIN